MKILYTKIAAFVPLVCLSHFAQSQSNFLPGSIVTSQGDTVAGFIDYRNWYRNPKTILFKKSAAEASINYTTSDVKAFTVSNETYERGFVNVESSPYKLEELDNSSTPQFKSDTTFLRNIIPGNKSLYYYKGNDDRDFFYIKTGLVFELLVHKQYKTSDDRNNAPYIGSAVVVKDNNFFLNQLSLYLQECPKIKNTLQNTKYTQSNLSKAFRVYYECKNENITIKSGNETKNKFGIVAGPSLATVHFKGLSFSGKSNLDSKIPVGGVYWNVFLPRSLSRLSSYNELMFTSFSIKGQAGSYSSPDNYEISDFKLGYSYLKLNTLIRYTQPLGKAFTFFNAGISNGYAVSETNEAITTKKFYSNETTTNAPIFSNTSKYEQGFLLGIGAGMNNLSGEIRYERSNGSINAVFYSNNIERYSFLLGYSF